MKAVAAPTPRRRSRLRPTRTALSRSPNRTSANWRLTIDAIPFFYADLIARMIPGAISLALLRLIALKPPQPWADFSTGSGNAVLLPLLYAGMAYVIGTVLEVLLSRPLESIYVCAFTSAAKTHAWTYELPQGKTTSDTRTAEFLSRASFGQLIVATADKESQVVAHLVRFHSEAKMCFTVSWLFVGFLALTFIQKCVDAAIIKPLDHNIVWLFILLLSIPVLVYVTYERLKSRARFILRAIERLAGENRSGALVTLRDQLRSFSGQTKPGRHSNDGIQPDRSLLRDSGGGADAER